MDHLTKWTSHVCPRAFESHWWPSGERRRLSDMKCTVMIWRSWVRTLVGSNLGCIVLLSQAVLDITSHHLISLLTTCPMDKSFSFSICLLWQPKCPTGPPKNNWRAGDQTPLPPSRTRHPPKKKRQPKESKPYRSIEIFCSALYSLFKIVNIVAGKESISGFILWDGGVATTMSPAISSTWWDTQCHVM